MIRPLCYEHHATEFNALPNSRRHEASSWITVAREDCAECKRLAELQPVLDALRIEGLEAEVGRLQRELHDEQVRRSEWEKMYNQAIAEPAPDARLGALVTEELAEKLERLVDMKGYYESTNDDDSARLAARIREALRLAELEPAPDALPCSQPNEEANDDRT